VYAAVAALAGDAAKPHLIDLIWVSLTRIVTWLLRLHSFGLKGFFLNYLRCLDGTSSNSNSTTAPKKTAAARVTPLLTAAFSTRCIRMNVVALVR
jgi:hypothetical protein